MSAGGEGGDAGGDAGGPGDRGDAGASAGAPRRGRGAVAIVLAALAGVAMIAAFAGRGRQPPRMSPTLEHRASLGARNAGSCLACHRPDGPARVRPAGHTPRHDCHGCHVIGE